MINVLDLFRPNRPEPTSQLEPVPEAERVAVCESCQYAVRLTRRQTRPLCPFCAERTVLHGFTELNSQKELAGRPREEVHG